MFPSAPAAVRGTSWQNGFCEAVTAWAFGAPVPVDGPAKPAPLTAGLNSGSKHCRWTAAAVCRPITSVMLMSYQSTDSRSRDNTPLEVGDWMTTPAVHVSAVSGVRSSLPCAVRKAKPLAAGDCGGEPGP